MVDFAQWDPKKAETNLAKHGVSFEEAATVFEDYFACSIPDKTHSVSERRFVTIGRSSLSRVLLVINVIWDTDVRIISARKPTNSERKTYDQQF